MQPICMFKDQRITNEKDTRHLWQTDFSVNLFYVSFGFGICFSLLWWRRGAEEKVMVMIVEMIDLL